jgi:hypothetical protein
MHRVRGQRVLWCFVALLGAILCGLPIAAHADDSIQEILTTRPLSKVVADREMCASGVIGQLKTAVDQAFAGDLRTSLADECVAYLVRLGHENDLDFLKGPDSSPSSASGSFDTGFVTAYHKAEQPPPNLPTVDTLRPIAIRCFEQTEPDAQLCYSVGYAYGLRAAQGEQVVAY